MNNEDYKDMLLESASGFMMPYILQSGTNEELQVSLGFGEQTHPSTGEKFNHEGVDLVCKDKPLYAMATGTIIGAGENAKRGNYIVAKYGKYEVTYGHVAEAYTPYGSQVRAGQEIAKSGDFLHLGVTFNGQVVDPMAFLSMIYANIEQLAAMGIQKQPTTEELGGKKVTFPYDNEKEDIMRMLYMYLPSYFSDLHTGSYATSDRIAGKLRNIFAMGADRNYYFETMPNLSNPLGLGARSYPLVEKIQKIFLEDFLNYMAVMKGMYPSSWDAEQKKNFLRKRQATD